MPWATQVLQQSANATATNQKYVHRAWPRRVDREQPTLATLIRRSRTRHLDASGSRIWETSGGCHPVTATTSLPIDHHTNRMIANAKRSCACTQPSERSERRKRRLRESFGPRHAHNMAPMNRLEQKGYTEIFACGKRAMSSLDSLLWAEESTQLCGEQKVMLSHLKSSRMMISRTASISGCAPGPNVRGVTAASIEALGSVFTMRSTLPEPGVLMTQKNGLLEPPLQQLNPHVEWAAIRFNIDLDALNSWIQAVGPQPSTRNGLQDRDAVLCCLNYIIRDDIGGKLEVLT
eukprot:scaffold125934_cov31-Tisochrysis_lutea.AAC.2